MELKMLSALGSFVIILACVHAQVTRPTTTSSSKSSFKVTTILHPPYLEERPRYYPSMQGNQMYRGFIKDLLDRLAEKGDFDYTLNTVEDGQYGSSDNGTWKGMIGELQRKEADIAAAGLTVTPERLAVVDFTRPIMTTGPTILLKKEQGYKYNIYAKRVFRLLLPFTYGTWLLIVLSFVLTGLVLYGVGRLSPYEWKGRSLDEGFGEECKKYFNARNSFWFALSTLTWQGYSKAPRAISGRIVAGTWWAFTLFILIGYTASLTRQFIVPLPGHTDPPIHSVEDLASQSDIKYGTIEYGSTSAFFRDSPINLFQKMWETMNLDPSVFVNTTKEGIEKVKASDGSYAFIVDASIAEYESGVDEECELITIGEALSQTNQALAVQKGSPLLDILNSAILEMQHNGELLRLQTKWWDWSGTCEARKPTARGSTGGSRGKPAINVEVIDLAFAFIVLAVGLVAGLLCCVGEILFSKRHGKRQSYTPRNAVVEEDAS
ncbi:unnamed protein product [Owenia fusiformis]|uniref:Uncharacterized protein n=1 Tax=Owenia fusiformis TaxID=6347 RepID=A0A8S4PD85_OWEFU|nr:unnamed protein product [Owenia fusiformis]